MTLSDEDDLLAGEYVLGTLERAEHAAASARRASDPDFDEAIRCWEGRLTTLSEAGAEVEAPTHALASILARIAAQGAPDAAASPNVVRLNRQVVRWKRATAASLALAACLAVWVTVGTVSRWSSPGQTFVAVLQKTDEAPAFVMQADLRDHRMSVKPIGAPPVPGKSYELWVIDPAIGPPRSLGVLGSSGSSRATLPDVGGAVLTRATYAVTIEPPGGAPGGVPTGAPVFVGHLMRTDP